ncbi:acetyl-CoA hydrolase/transferase C-terminal domain-containing protein [Aliidiomarina sp. Khilg15.8]
MKTATDLAQAIIKQTAGQVRLALPLGIGKANSIANALVEQALHDPKIELKIFTALTLMRPAPGNDMQRRFMQPAQDRLFGQYPELLYVEHLRKGTLPANIEVDEFYMQAGQWLNVASMQQAHICANYTHAMHYLLARKPNVVAQLLARDEDNQLSLSCNTDISADLLKARREGSADFLFVGEVNSQLPFMGGPAIIANDEVDMLYAPEQSFELFSVVKRPVDMADQAIGLHASRLVKDGGTLQIGIGSIGDAIAHALLLRNEQNETYRELVDVSQATLPADAGDDGPFTEGLYAVTEMLVDGILQLFERGLVRREVDGAAIHAGFFADTRDFYQRLRELPPQQRARITMMPVSYTNALYGDQTHKIEARRDARFINNAMNVTLLGEVASDTLENGQVVSGVGGQYDFVAQAFALPGARAVIAVNATRLHKGKAQSNIVWTHRHLTLPRHLRDIIITEYGIADLRGKSDAGCIKALLAITDSRFQTELMKQAKDAGKLAADYEIPREHQQNTPEALKQWLGAARRSDVLPEFPFGSDFSEVERRLLPALSELKQHAHSKRALGRLIWQGSRTSPTEADKACLERMQLQKPASIKERLNAWALRGALIRSRQ